MRYTQLCPCTRLGCHVGCTVQLYNISEAVVLRTVYALPCSTQTVTTLATLPYGFSRDS